MPKVKTYCPAYSVGLFFICSKYGWSFCCSLTPSWNIIIVRRDYARMRACGFNRQGKTVGYSALLVMACSFNLSYRVGAGWKGKGEVVCLGFCTHAVFSGILTLGVYGGL